MGPCQVTPAQIIAANPPHASESRENYVFRMYNAMPCGDATNAPNLTKIAPLARSAYDA